MASYLKQSTAIEVKLGPFVDAIDAVTPETGLTIAQADVRLAKNGGDWAQKNEATTMVHEENGWYRCLLNTTDTDTLGTLIVAVNESGALPVWREFVVLAANVYDALVGGGDLLDVSTVQFDGSTIPQTGGRLEVNLTHIGGSTLSLSTAQIGVNVVNAAGTAWNSAAITSSTFASGAITAGSIAANAIGASELATDAVDEIAEAVMSALVETGLTVREAQRLMASALFSKVSGAGTTTIVFRNVGDTKDRITATVDANGNRSAITLDDT